MCCNFLRIEVLHTYVWESFKFIESFTNFATGVNFTIFMIAKIYVVYGPTKYPHTTFQVNILIRVRSYSPKGVLYTRCGLSATKDIEICPLVLMLVTDTQTDKHTKTQKNAGKNSNRPARRALNNGNVVLKF